MTDPTKHKDFHVYPPSSNIGCTVFLTMVAVCFMLYMSWILFRTYVFGWESAMVAPFQDRLYLYGFIFLLSQIVLILYVARKHLLAVSKPIQHKFKMRQEASRIERLMQNNNQQSGEGNSLYEVDAERVDKKSSSP